MTKEELEKEADEYSEDTRFIDYSNYSLSENINISDEIKEAYLAGAEPREKRIAELEGKLKVETEWNNRLGVAYREYEQLTKEQDEHLAELEKEIKSLGERCLQLQKDKGELPDKVRELEQENERLKGDLELWESGACKATNLDKCVVVNELKAQIEKMRNCRNCKKNCEGYRNCTLQNLCYWEWDNGDIH